ncbi:MAG: DMT family transporter [Puniceicoccaceae bacterium]
MLKGFFWSLLAYAAYSSHDALVKVLRDYSIFQIIFFAMLFGLVPFSLSRLRDPNPVSLRPVKPGWVTARSCFGVGSLVFAFSAFKQLPMVQVYVLLFLTPLIVTIVAIPVLGERVHLIRWTAILVGLAGILIVLRPSPQSLQWGHLFGFCAACCGAGGAIVARKVSAIENRSTMILYPILTTIAVCGIATLFVYQPMPLQDLLLMFGIGLLGLIGQSTILQAFRHAPAATIAPMQYSQLIWANFFGITFFGESIDRWILIGSAITVASGMLIIWRETRFSATQPNLRTRNTRSVVAAPVVAVESERRDPFSPSI